MNTILRSAGPSPERLPCRRKHKPAHRRLDKSAPRLGAFRCRGTGSPARGGRLGGEITGLSALQSDGPSPTTGYLARNKNQGRKSGPWFIIFRFSYENKFSTSTENNKPDDFSSGFVFLAVRTGRQIYVLS